MDLTTRVVTTLTANQVMDNWPVFSADGRWIFAVRTLEDGAEIWRLPADGIGEAALIYTTTAWVANLTISPDGQSLLFSEGAVDSPNAQLLVVPATGGVPRTLNVISGLSVDWYP